MLFTKDFLETETWRYYQLSNRCSITFTADIHMDTRTDRETDRRTDRAISTFAVDADKEYMHDVGSATPPSACYVHFRLAQTLYTLLLYE